MDERQTLIVEELGRALRDVMPAEGAHKLPSSLHDLLGRLRATDDSPQFSAQTNSLHNAG